jgi:very-short-patch-repair endonuclease
VEFDGQVHRERGVFVADLRRQNALVAAGWTVLRFPSADVLGRPESVVALIRRALLG